MSSQNAAPAANQAVTNPSGDTQGVTKHSNEKSIEKALGIGRGGKRLNASAQDVQYEIDEVRDEYLQIMNVMIDGVRHDVMKNGMLGEIVGRTPIIVYDLPELKELVPTAFVDGTGKMFINDDFARRLLAEHKQGKDSLNFLIGHEADHLRRIHLQRMSEFPHQLANVAQDIRINIDLTRSGAAAMIEQERGSHYTPSEKEVEAAAKRYLEALSGTAVGVGCAMNFEDFKKWGTKSEEAIAAELMKTWKEPPQMPNREVSFERIMEGAAQEADNVKGLLLRGVPLPKSGQPAASLTPADLSGLAQDLRAIGQAKANPNKVSDADLQSAMDRLKVLLGHQGLIELDLKHNQGVTSISGTGGAHASGKTGDAYLDQMSPSGRVKLAIKVLEKILQPQLNNGVPAKPQNGGMTLKDIERAMRGGQKSQNAPGKGGSAQSQAGDGDQQSQDATTVPSPNVIHGHDHVMSTQELTEALKEAGVSQETMEKLGYDDLQTVEEETRATKDGMVSAINKASEDMMRVGSRYPGGHLVNYAKAQMLDFFKPVITWEMSVKKIIEGSGKGLRYEQMEPWTIYSVEASDMGFKSQRDVPYQGSLVQGKPQKPLIFVPIDTSGSVDDAMLKRFISETINMSRKVGRGTAPDVVMVFADTIARGQPVFITEKNYKSFMDKGVTYGGRGGTNLQAGIESIFELVKPGSKSGYARRKIDAIIYMTDLGDAVPNPQRLLAKANECGLPKIPTTLFLAPRICYSEHFNREARKWAEVVYFDSGVDAQHTTKVNLDKIEKESQMKQASLKP